MGIESRTLTTEIPITVIIPTVEEETANLLRIRGSLKFINANPRYRSDLVLPDDSEFAQADELRLASLVREKYYNPIVYQHAQDVYNSPAVKTRIARAFPQFSEWQQNWGFEIPEAGYEIHLTCWGLAGTAQYPGAMHIRVGADGMLIEEADPAQMFIHEGIHDGTHQFTHPLRTRRLISSWENESIVRHLQANLTAFPEYATRTASLLTAHPQAIDKFLADGVRLNANLPACLNEFLVANNRIEK